MKLKSLSLAALAAFMFAGSLAVNAAPIETACQACERVYEACGTSQSCTTTWLQCMRRNRCPL